jgi:hypothetical protein
MQFGFIIVTLLESINQGGLDNLTNPPTKKPFK